MRAGLMTTAGCGCEHRLRNEHADVGAVAGLALNRERAVHFPENRAADRQAEAVAVRLGREERLEHPRQILRGNPASGIGDRDLDRRDRSARTVTMIRPPCGVASRALVSRLRNTCSRSLWLQATSGISSGTFTCSSMALRLMPYFRMADAGLDGAPHLPVAAPPRRIPRKRQHPAKNPPADLERLLDVLEILREHHRGEHAAAEVRLHLLDQRQHRPERVVHVV